MGELKTLKQYLESKNTDSYTIPISSSEHKHFEVATDLNSKIMKRFPGTIIVLVGGSCRDLFYRKFFGEEVQKNINDLDYSIFKSNNQGLNDTELTNVMEYIKSLGDYNVIDELDHLHLKILTKADNYEIEYTSTRKEAYQDTSRKPETSVGTVIDDIVRRDFTINAIYLNIDEINSDNIVVSPYNEETKTHIDHVRQKLLKTTTENPETVFSDDPLRVLRAIRFSGYGYDMEPGLEKAVKEFPKDDLYKKVSYERISDELGKILQKGDIDYLIKSGFIKNIIEEFGNFDDKPYKDYELQHIIDVVKMARKLAPKGQETIFLLAGLLHDVGKGGKQEGKENDVGEWSDRKNRWTFNGHEKVSSEIARRFMKKFKFSNSMIKSVGDLIDLHMESKFYDNAPLKTIIMWILKYSNQQKYPNLIDNVLIFNSVDWGGKSDQWKKDNPTLMKADAISDKINKLRNVIDPIVDENKQELAEISKEIGQDKNIPNVSKPKAILKRKANFIIGKIKNNS